MVSTFTPNVQIEEPARGDDVGTWDTPVNNNSTLFDLLFGGTTTVALTNANVTLSAAQFQCANIVFTGTLTANVVISFPSSFKKPYTVQNLCTGAFAIQLAATGGVQAIGCPPGQPFDAINDGTNIKFKNFGPHIGGYWDFAGSSMPNWVSACTVPPYLNCDGSTFSAVTYPTLNAILGGTTLPDSRGRARHTLNQGTGRITSGGGGVDGNTLFASGGSEFTQSHTHAFTGNALGTHSHTFGGNCMSNSPCGTVGGVTTGTGDHGEVNSVSAVSAGTPSGTNAGFGSGGSQNMSPSYVGGLTLIRAA